MQFFSGFSLQNEELLFQEFVDNGNYSVCGFSYGAIKALQHTKKLLENAQRVDRLQLLSPAFFQTKSKKFRRLQVLAYSKNQEAYMKQFMHSCFAPYVQKELEHTATSITQLEELLEYQWQASDFLELEAKGVTIEVYLGAKDKIIDVENARDFFLELSCVTYLKEANHFLQTK